MGVCATFCIINTRVIYTINTHLTMAMYNIIVLLLFIIHCSKFYLHGERYDMQIAPLLAQGPLFVCFYSFVELALESL